MLLYIFALILGIFAGSITGLIPGIHINLVAIAIITSSAFLLQYFSPLVIVIFLVSMAITHTFLDTIPSIFLGAPEEATALSVLPGHELLLQGRGYEAVWLMALGSLFALFIILIVSPFYIIFLPPIYPFFQKYMVFILIAASLFLILRDKNKTGAFLIFVLAGLLGIATLNLTIIKQPLFPLLSGLFGASLLTVSFFKNVKLPEQKIAKEKINKKETTKTLVASLFSSSLCSFLPGIGASQAAVIGSELSGKLSRKSFLILIGAIGTATIGLGFTALYAIGKPRHGVAVAVNKILEIFSLTNLLLLLLVMIISGVIAFFLTLGAAKFLAKRIYKIRYKILCLIVMLFIAIMSVAISGPIALIVLATGTALGILASLWGIEKIHLMGCLLLPVILYYLL